MGNDREIVLFAMDEFVLTYNDEVAPYCNETQTFHEFHKIPTISHLCFHPGSIYVMDSALSGNLTIGTCMIVNWRCIHQKTQHVCKI